MIEKKCARCRQPFLCHQERVLLCQRCYNRQQNAKKGERKDAIQSGFAHKGEGFTPVPDHVLQRIRFEKEQERIRQNKLGIISFAFPHVPTEATEAMPDWRGDIRDEVRQSISNGKAAQVSKGVACCVVCGRVLTVYGCPKHREETT